MDRGRGLQLLMALLLSIHLSLFNPCSEASRGPRIPSSSRLNSSVIFPVHGNVYPKGLFYVAINIGNPPKTYFLDIDTGSDLTWLQCDAPCKSCMPAPHSPYKPSKSKLVECEDPLCIKIHDQESHQCEVPTQCDYEIAYADMGLSQGVLVKDVLSIPFADGYLRRTPLAFGCGFNQQSPSVTEPSLIDGVLGLGRGKISIVSQLKDLGLTQNVMGHCFSRQGGGYLFIGDGFVPYSKLTWVPMHNSSPSYYSPGVASLLFGNQPMGAKSLHVVFDSGSSFTYFASRPYKALLSMLKKHLNGKELKEAPEDGALPLCWKGKRRFNSVHDVKKFFKPIVMVFANVHKSKLEIPPEDYLIISSDGNVCLGILNGTETGLGNLNIIGDISMLDLMVVYDNERNQIGWFPGDCKRVPSEAPNHGIPFAL